jgi:hypothetical protein
MLPRGVKAALRAASFTGRLGGNAMRSRLWLGLGLAGLLIAVGGVTVASASSDITTAKTIHFVARQTSFSFVDVGKKGASDGDYIVATEDDFQAGTKIGHNVFKCTFIQAGHPL